MEAKILDGFYSHGERKKKVELLPVCVLMCLLRRDGLSKALLQTPHGSNVLSLGLALGVGNADSERSPWELMADELSPEMDFLSSSADGGDPVNALVNRDIDKSNGESVTKLTNEKITRKITSELIILITNLLFKHIVNVVALGRSLFFTSILIVISTYN